MRIASRIDQTLADKTAVITGSTSGIGLAIAKRLAASGANILLNGIEAPDTQSELIENFASEYEVKVRYSNADMSQPKQIEAMFTQAEKDFGHIDILVNNAGIQFVHPIEDYPTEKWDQIIAINLSSAFHTIKHSVPLMKSQGWGRIINIASAHALAASPFKSAYVAAKHGVLGLTRTVALELAQDQITCNAICPGYVKTPLVENQITDTAKARGISAEEVINDVMLTAQPTKSFVSMSDVAEYAWFLCQDSAKNITGSAQSIDGGWTAK